jgi:hypothetical protein
MISDGPAGSRPPFNPASPVAIGWKPRRLPVPKRPDRRSFDDAPARSRAALHVHCGVRMPAHIARCRALTDERSKNHPFSGHADSGDEMCKGRGRRVCRQSRLSCTPHAMQMAGEAVGGTRPIKLAAAVPCFGVPSGAKPHRSHCHMTSPIADGSALAPLPAIACFTPESLAVCSSWGPWQLKRLEPRPSHGADSVHEYFLTRRQLALARTIYSHIFPLAMRVSERGGAGGGRDLPG